MKHSSLHNRLVGRWQAFWIWRCTATCKNSHFSDSGYANAMVTNGLQCSMEMP